MITELHIKLTNGKWTVNGNPYSAMTLTEREFFHRFLDEVRPHSAISDIKKIAKSFVELLDFKNDPIFTKALSQVETNY